MEKKVKIERNATVILRKALEDCKACQLKKPECGDQPPICFPDVECRDTYSGPVCGPCPPGWCGDGRVLIYNLLKIYHHSLKKRFNFREIKQCYFEIKSLTR